MSSQGCFLPECRWVEGSAAKVPLFHLCAGNKCHSGQTDRHWPAGDHLFLFSSAAHLVSYLWRCACNTSSVCVWLCFCRTWRGTAFKRELDFLKGFSEQGRLHIKVSPSCYSCGVLYCFVCLLTLILAFQEAKLCSSTEGTILTQVSDHKLGVERWRISLSRRITGKISVGGLNSTIITL